MRRYVHSALILLVVGSLALASTLAWQHWTRAPIAEAEQQFYARRFLSVLPPHSYDNQPLSTPVPLPAEQPPHSRIMAAYRADRGTTPVAVVLVSQVQGYAAPIRLTIAINVQGRLIGTQVIEHQESPGLGGRISDPQVNWLAQFADRRLEDRWALKRDQGDFDQLAGATVTSRAVIEAQQDALRYFDQHRALLLGTLAHD
ncbi:electron transporter RnfG [Pseudomonas sp. SG-MS2]|uniref:RnfABCDGE type electron transport complex subunit G n=1 Tax=Pseudomonas sp. SG-MS2 TaxID=1914534 RepID=UPI00137A9148|nr:RnfABCDGE type electron transport complex subunit G [Pseudomonas sp. SG-MS2]KAF1310942.1 electron transporter RnfG [Pseudomonas sp. SG-MS2]